MQYHRNLLHLCNKFTANTRLPEAVWTVIKSCGLRAKPPTHRGKRAGARKAIVKPVSFSNTSSEAANGNATSPQDSSQAITTVMNIFKPQRQSRSRSVHASNLITVRRESLFSKPRNINFTVWNARSVDGKLQSVSDSIIENNTDVFAVTETWFKESDNNIAARLTSSLSGYNIHQVPRVKQRGGGIAVITRSTLKFTQNKTLTFKFFEIMDCNLNFLSSVVRFIVVYRPPKCTINDFLSEFSTFLETVICSAGRLIIVGDFNIHVDNPADPNAERFSDFLHSIGLSQHMIGPTHTKGHTLDLIITRSADHCIYDIESDWCLPSDHAALHFSSIFTRPQPRKLLRSSRKLANIDIDIFQRKIASSLPSSDFGPHVCVDELVKMYNNAMTSAIDEVAPVVNKYVLDKARAPWFTEDLLPERRNLRQLERQWRKTGLVVHEEMFKSARNQYSAKLREAHSSFHRSRIANADTKDLFGIIDDIAGTKHALASTIPELDPVELPDIFAKFFHSKIEQIREKMSFVPPSDISVNSRLSLCSFEPVTIEFVEKLISSLPSKSSSLDPVPTVLIKQCLHQVSPTIMHIINTSFTSGEFPQLCKSAIVRPLLKKPGLDKNVLKNYRPVSNLPYISKLIEKSALTQINSHLANNNLFAKCQSAYREGHSTETALIRVQNDVLRALDKRDDVILILLDLSAAFDTIDHKILIHRLHHRFGFNGTVLQWIKSYLQDRTMKVSVGSVVSGVQSLDCGSPRVPYLGPCYSHYTQHLLRTL